MIIRIISLLCLFATISFAQEIFGPVSTDYRMKLWKNWSGSVIYEGSLQSPTSNIDIGKEYQYRVNRIAYQWNIDYSDIPQNSTIDKVKITYKYAYQDASSNLPLFIYELDKNLNDSEPDIGNLYLGMNGTSAAYGRKIGEWHDVPNQLVTFETTSYNINTWRTVIDNALQKGKLVIGFKSSVEDWENSPNRNYRIRSDSVTLQIEFTPPTRNVILNQKLSTGTSVGVLKHWEGSAWSSDIAPGTEKTLSVGGNEVFLGDQNIYSNQKYNNWNSNFNNVQNFKSIEIDEFTTSIQSNFEPTYSGITIENSIEGTSINSGNIQFKDPWFIDYPDQEFNGTLRNRGMNDAIFYQRSSPFHPDYNTSYEGITYKGAFLNQDYNIPGQPYYSVKAPQQTITINGNNHQIYFLNWSATNAALQNFTSAETGVAFNSGNAVVTARYKAIDLTNNVNALTNNNQAKIIRTGTSSNGTLFKVYESMDCVWLEKSTNNGSSWELMNDGKPLNDIDNEWKGKSPSLALDYNYNKNFYVVFQEYQDFGYGGDVAKIKVIYYKDDPIPSLIEDYLPNVQLMGNMLSDAQPVIAKTIYDRFLVVWRVPVGFETNTPAGLYYHYVGHRYTQNYFDWKNNEEMPLLIPNTSSATYNPSIATGWSGASDPFHLAFQYGIGQIRYCQLTQNGNRTTITPQYFETISNGSGFTTNRNPSIAMKDNYPAVSWFSTNTSLGGHIDIEDPPAVVKKTISRIKLSSGWSNFVQNGNDVVSHHLASSRDGNIILIWNEYTNGIYTSKIAENLLVIPQSYNSINSKVVTANHSAALDGITAFGLNSQGSLPYDFQLQIWISAIRARLHLQ